jgi:hypothetical protein
MKTRAFTLGAFIVFVLVAAGCATSPIDEAKRKEMEADIDDILSYEHDPAEVGDVSDCLPDTAYRSYRALGNRHLLFEGRKGRQWVNVLRGRCFNLDDNSVFIMTPSLAGRLCALDRFNVVDRIDSVSSARAAPACVLGEFKPVTEAQVKEIEDRLEMR